MAKVQMGPQTLIYPMPALIIGANVDGKPNFMTAAWGGICNGEPPMVSVGIRPERFTFKGIKQNMTFSVNIPSAELVKETDYCGMVSGAKADKVKTCGFEVFYGKLNNAPLIEQCPVNLECKVVNVIELGSHHLFIGRIEETYLSDSCLTAGKPDVNKIKPIIYSAGQYVAYGDILAKAFNIGKLLIK